MKNKQSKLEQLKGQNPFSVPEGYMEGLTDKIMSQLPEKPKQEVVRVSMVDRIKPWFYLAAVFVGLGLFFRAIIGVTSTDDGARGDSLLVHTEVSYGDIYTASSADNALYDEDDEYLEYLEIEYANYILAEEMGFSE